MTDINVTSFAVEVVRETKTRVFVTSAAVECIRKVILPRMRASSLVIEVLRTGVVKPRAQIVIATGD